MPVRGQGEGLAAADAGGREVGGLWEEGERQVWVIPGAFAPWERGLGAAGVGAVGGGDGGVRRC